jgi:Tfp pilus assembly protein PilX
MARRLCPWARPALSGEGGFVMVVAMMLLLVITLSIGAMATAATDVNNQSTRQGKAELADAAADSGAQVALYRLNTAGTTAAGSGTMGGGASYSYTVAALTSSSSACAGLWVQNSSSTLVQDCITSTGTVGAVSERVELRVVGYAATASSSPFTVNGVFAINGLSTNEVSGAFTLASNGSLGLSNATLTGINGSIEYLSGKLSESQNSNQMCTGTCTLDPVASAITVPTVSASLYSAAASTNNDLTSGDISYVNASFSSSTDILTATNNNATVTFAPGTYYLCGINVNGFSNFAIDTTGAGLVTIYIDSSYRSGSTCSSGAGDIYDAGNSTGAINGTEPSSDLQLYFYGDPGCTTSCPAAISPMNAATFNADIFAPYSSMTSGGAFTMEGALVIGEFTANNNFTFTYQAPTSSGGSGSGTVVPFYPQAHEDCVASTSYC